MTRKYFKSINSASQENNIITVKASKQKRKNESKRKNKPKNAIILESTQIYNHLWLTMSESAKVGGINNKTVRRAVQAQSVRYKVVGNRYFIELTSLIKYLFSKKKLINKFSQYGLGQYVDKWKE